MRISFHALQSVYSADLREWRQAPIYCNSRLFLGQLDQALRIRLRERAFHLANNF